MLHARWFGNCALCKGSQWLIQFLAAQIPEIVYRVWAPASLGLLLYFNLSQALIGLIPLGNARGWSHMDRAKSV
jgi:hypothetical protein